MELLRADEELADVPIMAVTAYAAQGDDERIRAAGAQAYVSKPISVVRFVEAVEQLLDAGESKTKQAEPVGSAPGRRVLILDPGSRPGIIDQAHGARAYLIFASLNSTCLRTTGSYLRNDIFSVVLRGFFLVT